MSSYFPIPRNIDLTFGSKKEVIRSSVTLINHPNNCLKKSLNRKQGDKDLIYYLYYLNGTKWKKYSASICKFGHHIEFKREEVNLENEKMLVIIPSYKTDLPEETYILPRPFSIRKDKSPIAERGSYNFTLCNSTSSYQGEYPDSISSLKKSSFFSFDSLRLNQEADCKSFLLLMNLEIDARKNETHRVNIYNPYNKEDIAQIDISSNTFSVIELGFGLNERISISQELLFISCATTTFIPLFLSAGISQKNYEISVEHTHPPTEMLWGLSKSEALRKLKRNWVKG